MGGVFVVEALSVMAQVSWFKYTQASATATGRRIFKMAPLHHHFEKIGLEGDAGRRALLDHHDAAVPGRPGEPEAALMETSCKDTPVLVLGLGDSGLAMARWCARAGAAVHVWDSRETPPHAAALREQVPAAALLGGALDADVARRRAAGAEEPGPRAAATRASRRCWRPRTRSGVPVQGELDLFVRALADLQAERGYAPKVLAITGTNGKTTTTAMTALLVERAGRGRDGRQHRPDDAADAGRGARRRQRCPRSGCSSCRASSSTACEGFEPSAATVLNLTQDHLDWHGSMAAYAAAKARVFGERAVMVVNRDDAAVEQLAQDAPLRPAPKPVRGQDAARRRAPDRALRPRRAAASPATSACRSRTAWPGWCARCRVDETVQRSRGGKPAAPAEDILIQRLMPADALRVRGRHNAANALAALALADRDRLPAGADAARPARVRRRAAPRRAHRELDGVDAFDDSKGTNVGATVAALNGLGDDKAPAKLVVILGGDGKGQDFAPLAEPVRAPRARGRDDRPRRGGDRGGAGADRRRRSNATRRSRRRRAGASARPAAATRCC